MRQINYRITIKILVSSGAALTLMILTLATLLAATNSAQTNDRAGHTWPNTALVPGKAVLPPAVLPSGQGEAITPTAEVMTPPLFFESSLSPDLDLPAPPPIRAAEPPLPDWVADLMNAGDLYTAQDGLEIVKSVQTGSRDNDIVFNGGVITYTITITNTGDQNIGGILILDALPDKTLSGVNCSGGDDCELVFDTEIVQGITGTTSVSVTRQVTWVVSSLAMGKTTSMTVSGKVGCQADGAIIKNRAFYTYKQGGVDRSGSSNEAQTRVRTPIDKDGETALSAGPSWCSDDLGGTWDMDWGDFDRDGDLDLAMGSFFGTKVYCNEGGQLTLFWGNARYTYGVRWLDADRDGILELAAVGNKGYVYSLEGDEFVETEFTSGYSYGVAVADYSGDGYLDLAIAGSDVQLYKNNGTGEFSFDQTPSVGYSEILAWGDYDNDGDQDLAVGGSTIEIFENDVNFVAVFSDTSVSYVYGIGWGDYNNDGRLDLAAADYSNHQVLIYENTVSGFEPPIPIATSPNDFTPLAVDWGDFDGDGQLELAVSEVPPRIYKHDPSSDTFIPIITLPDGVVGGTFDPWWSTTLYAIPSIRGIDYDSDGDLDLALGNLYGRSLLFTTFAPHLNPTLSWIDSSPFVSVAWGDADHDGDPDLLFGAGFSASGSAAFGSGLYYNEDGEFSSGNRDLIGGFGPRSVAFGDVDGDGGMDIALGTSGQNELYLAGNTGAAAWTSSPSGPSNSVAWGDADNDGDLDLLVGNGGANLNALYINQGTQLNTVPTWISVETDDTRSVAWGDYNRDRYLDFAVGNNGQPNRVYCNNGDNTFSLVWSSPVSEETRSVAWADYDGDSDLDLAVGNYGAANYIYENLTCQNLTCQKLPFQSSSCQNSAATLSARPVWTSTTNAGTAIYSNTTSLAWGDWDNDGDLDLAVGNDGEPDQVYANLGSEPGSPQLAWLWVSDDAFKTTGVAWGDKDGDGDLDLAISQNGDDRNGVYENTYVSPSHLQDDFASTMPLPDNPTYLSIARPGNADLAYLYSSAELLSGPVVPTVTVRFKLFDPDGSRAGTGSNEYGDDIIPGSTRYEFSLDGGGTWQPATGQLVFGPGGDSGLEDTRRLGQAYTFLWDAQQDQAISDNARFRIRIVNHLGPVLPPAQFPLPRRRAGLTQRASVSAISPPFRVGGLSCQWPGGLSIQFAPEAPQVGEMVRVEGNAAAGSGVLVFSWDFGDTFTAIGQVVQHSYAANNTYVVTLTVSGEPCPITEPAVVTRTIAVGTGVPDKLVYLPLIFKSSSGGTTSGTMLGPPAQVTGLSGSAQPDDGATHLAWEPNAATGAVSGYRIYRRARATEGAFRLLATVPADVTTYTDDTSACGHAYYVTAFNPVGESPVSTASYFSPPCQR